jgi:hypothetical protein
MMHPFQLVILATAPTDWTRDESHQGRRVLTAEELDELADWGWRWAGFTRAMATCANVVRLRWRPRASNRVEPTPLSASEATA